MLDLDAYDNSEIRELYYQFEGINIKYQNSLEMLSLSLQTSVRDQFIVTNCLYS